MSSLPSERGAVALSITRTVELEQHFATLHLEKARHEELARQLHDELMRIQGAVAELERLPDHPQG